MKEALPGHKAHGNEITSPGDQKLLSHTGAGYYASVQCVIACRC